MQVSQANQPMPAIIPPIAIEPTMTTIRHPRLKSGTNHRSFVDDAARNEGGLSLSKIIAATPNGTNNHKNCTATFTAMLPLSNQSGQKQQSCITATVGVNTNTPRAASRVKNPTNAASWQSSCANLGRNLPIILKPFF